ncbi:MAG: ABC transporter ATP-binding protein [Clostridia bacterium]|jgi:oligopeptide transport system ATP-binding protein|nr:ABC transporter ATP-binding protein [Clostridia bacterium]MCI2000107.1 ABC transporter ATP-binding protein [Clostridia bacterium]MCI2014728.1 ABC transporter ATP-binding protein [Clostridia bacterium]
MENILEIKNLSLSFYTPSGEIEALRNINLQLGKGEILGIVGESGCGKTVLSKTVLRLLPKNAKIKNGEILLNGKDIVPYSESKMRGLRGSVMSMVFQDPMTTLNPTIPIGKQITESILKHSNIKYNEAKKQAIEMLDMVGIDSPEKRFAMQPHFFSGGMRQRCVLAIALASKPEILFADEPTTALDVTVQAKILDILLKIRDETRISIVFITHDFGVVARIADRIAVMYAGKIVEVGKTEEIFYDPRHPYTWGLLSSLPYFAKKGEPLKCIPGMPPVMMNLPKGDVFATRNKYALDIDYEKEPPIFDITDTHKAATWLLDKRAPKIKPPKFFGGECHE